MRKHYVYSRFLFFTCLVFVCGLTSRSQVMINEYSCANISTVADNFGEYNDWVELYNAGSSAVNLTGYHMSDNVNNPTKWAFQAVLFRRADSSE